MAKKELIADIRDRYRNAKTFIERGYSHKDTAKIEYDYPQITHNQASILTNDMYEIYKASIQIQLFDITNKIHWYQDNTPKDKTSPLLGDIRSDIRELSMNLFNEKITVVGGIGKRELEEATEIAIEIAIREREN